jgi:endogenous inhibitor of DNA gyrase (YacG/DUF329 family)
MQPLSLRRKPPRSEPESAPGPGCRVCGKPVPPIAQAAGDAFCSTECCQAVHHVQWPAVPDTERGRKQRWGRLLERVAGNTGEKRT